MKKKNEEVVFIGKEETEMENQMRKKIKELEEQMCKETNPKKIEEIARAIMALEKCETETAEQEELKVRMETELKNAKGALKASTINLILTGVFGALSVGITAWAAKETVQARRNQIKTGMDYEV